MQVLPVLNIRFVFFSAVLFFLHACSHDTDKPAGGNDIWDLNLKAPPHFISQNYIEIDKIARISRFRSGVGHDYSDFTEHCRSMKHYFEPLPGVDWTKVKIYSPVTGIITRMEQEWSGTKIEIASAEYPAFRFSIFHIVPASSWTINQAITEGTLLGTHVGTQTYSDISVIVNDITKQGRMVSWFDVITDGLFAEYQAAGIGTRESMIIQKQERDLHPLTCNGDTFIGVDSLDAWVNLIH
ncbi:MAG: hypothetical protein U0T82_16610 [Bacteroidales bacterium]